MSKQGASENEQDKGPVMGEAVPASIREAMAIVRGQEPSNDVVPEINLAEVFPLSAKIERRKAAEAQERAEQEAREQARKEAEAMIGKMVDGKGVYLGAREIKDRDGKRVGEFDLYAAPDDLKKGGLFGKKQLLMTFNKAVQHVAGLQDYHGYKGFNHNVGGRTPDEALYDALRDGTYKGEWFIPPKDVLNDSLYQNKDKGDLSGTFVTTNNGSDGARWYWSCTEHASVSSYAWIQRFADGVVGCDLKDDFELSVRCVRAELRP